MENRVDLKSKEMLESLEKNSKNIVRANIVMIIGVIVLFATFLLAVGATFITGGFMGSAEGAIFAMLGSLLIGLIISMIFLIYGSYILYTSTKDMKYTSETDTSTMAKSLNTSITILYYSALLGLIGSILLIIGVGILLVGLAALLWDIGLILFAMELKKFGEDYEEPSNLLMVGAILSLLGVVIHQNLGSLLIIAGLVLILVGFNKLSTVAEKDRMELMRQTSVNEESSEFSL